MDISFQIIGDNITKEILINHLTEEQISCLRVEMSYQNGNPEPKFYSELLKKDWFNVDNIDAKNYLDLDSNKFYIDIFAYDYKLEDLDEQERQDMFNKIELIENELLNKYGTKSSFEIYFNKDYQVKYMNGVKE